MIKKSLVVLVLVNFGIVVAFVICYTRDQSFVPIYIGLLPFVLCNFIYTREFICPKAVVDSTLGTNQPVKKLSLLPLLIMPIGFCLYLPALIKFDSSIGWSPVVCLGFSLLLSIVIIALYGGVKTALKCKKS